MGSLRDALKDISPPWLSTGNGEKFMYCSGLLIDVQLQRLVTTILSRFPLKALPSALANLGSDRNIVRGFYETDKAYAARIAQALTDWHYAGMPRSIMRQLLGLLSPKNPMIRLIDNLNNWSTYADQANSQLPPTHNDTLIYPFNWDNTATWQFFTVIYNNLVGTEWITQELWGTLGQRWGDTSGTWGNENITVDQWKTFKRIVQIFKPAHSKSNYIIISFDNSLFEPTNNTTYPTDGLSVNDSKNVAGVDVSTRYSNCLYIIDEDWIEPVTIDPTI